MLVMLWNICDGILLLHYSAPTQLGIGSSCQSRTHYKMQQSYCNYSGEERCCNQYSLRERRCRRVSRCSISRRDVNVMRIVLLIMIKYV